MGDSGLVTTGESGPPIAVAGRGFDQPRTIATILGGLFLAGATIGAYSLVLPHPQMMLEHLRGSLPEGQTSSAVCLWDGTESAESLTARADTALYAAKAAGRDRVIGT
jgi:hypothetical protein